MLSLSFARIQPTVAPIKFNLEKNILWTYVGNDDGYFTMEPSSGQVFQVKEIDLESVSFDRFVMEVQAMQKDSPLKTAEAKGRKIKQFWIQILVIA